MLALWRSLRPRQWIKNLFLFAALVFAERLDDPAAVIRASAAFGLFCLLSSGLYLINDLIDRERDRLHPRKRLRPIASGRVSPGTAVACAAIFLASGLGGAALLGVPFLAVAGTFVALQIAYSAGTKHVAFLDGISVSAGFVLRAVAGGLAIAVTVSPWLLVCTFFLALFLSLGKRRREIALLGSDAGRHRRSLRGLDVATIDHLLSIVAPCCILAYTLYTIASGQPVALVYTVPLVVFGFFRYLQLVRTGDLGDDPSEAVFRDRALLGTLLVWGAASALLLYLY